MFVCVGLLEGGRWKCQRHLDTKYCVCNEIGLWEEPEPFFSFWGEPAAKRSFFTQALKTTSPFHFEITVPPPYAKKGEQGGELKPVSKNVHVTTNYILEYIFCASQIPNVQGTGVCSPLVPKSNTESFGGTQIGERTKNAEFKQTMQDASREWSMQTKNAECK